MATAGRDALLRFAGELRKLRRLAGSPSLNRLAALAAGAPRPLPRSTISDKLAGKSLPDWEFVRAFVSACAAHAEQAGAAWPDRAGDLSIWEARHWRLLRAIDSARAEQRLGNAAAAELRRGAGARATGEPGRPAPGVPDGPGAGPPPGTPADAVATTSPATVVGPGGPAAIDVPRQLPAPCRHFVGRERELAWLSELAASADREGAVGIAMIDGGAGVGKTALAVYWAHRAVDRFPDGQLHVDLRGFDPSGRAVAATEAVRGFLAAMQVPPQQIPAEAAAQIALFRTRLSGRRMLLVLDNARGAEQVRPLLPGSPGCFVIVTSRTRLTGLVAREGASPLVLPAFTDAEARELLNRRVGDAARLSAEPEAIESIIRACARLPLALTVIAARVVTGPEVTFESLAVQLNDARRGLDALDTGGDPATDVRSVISWSYRSLSPPAARLFRLLGLHPGPDIGTPAAASLAGEPPDRAALLLAELSAAHLIDGSTTGRFTMHDLLRAYAVDLVARVEPPERQRAAQRRLLDHYLTSAHAADHRLAPPLTPTVPPPPAPGVRPESFGGEAEASAWFTAERAVLLATVRYAAAAAFDEHAWMLTRALGDFLDRNGEWPQWAAVQRDALRAAARLRDPVAEAHSHRGLAGALSRLGHHREARRHLSRALTLFESRRDHAAAALTLMNLGWVCQEQGGQAEARDRVRQALELFRSAGVRHGEAMALNALGWLHVQERRNDLALDCAVRAVAIYQTLDDHHATASAWDTAGCAHHRLGRYAEAVTSFERALELRRAGGGGVYRSNVLVHLGDAYEAMGDRPAARRALTEALRLLEEMDHPDAGKLRARIDSTVDAQSRQRA